MSLVHHVVGPEHLVGAGGGVTHGACLPSTLAVASLWARSAGGARLKYILIQFVFHYRLILNMLSCCVSLIRIKFSAET